MSWWMWGIVIVVVLGSIFTYLTSPAKGGKEVKCSRRAADPAKKTVAKPLSEDATERLRDRISDQTGEDNYSSALNNIAKLLDSPHYDENYDGENCAEDISQCFSSLSEDKQPAQVLKVFGTLREKGSVIDHALQHDKHADFGNVFCDSLSAVEQSKLTAAQCTALLDLVENGDELVEMAKFNHKDQVLSFVNDLADVMAGKFQFQWEYHDDLATALQLLREKLPKPKKRKEKSIDKETPSA